MTVQFLCRGSIPSRIVDLLDTFGPMTLRELHAELEDRFGVERFDGVALAARRLRVKGLVESEWVDGRLVYTL